MTLIIRVIDRVVTTTVSIMVDVVWKQTIFKPKGHLTTYVFKENSTIQNVMLVQRQQIVKEFIVVHFKTVTAQILYKQNYWNYTNLQTQKKQFRNVQINLAIFNLLEQRLTLNIVGRVVKRIQTNVRSEKCQ